MKIILVVEKVNDLCLANKFFCNLDGFQFFLLSTKLKRELMELPVHSLLEIIFGDVTWYYMIDFSKLGRISKN